MQIAKHDNFRTRIFPIVLGDAKIYDPVGRIGYVEYWEAKQTELDSVMSRVALHDLEVFHEQINLYAEIRALLPKLMDVLSDMNSLTTDLHRQSNFSELFAAVMAKLNE